MYECQGHKQKRKSEISRPISSKQPAGGAHGNRWYTCRIEAFVASPGKADIHNALEDSNIVDKENNSTQLSPLSVAERFPFHRCNAH